MNYKKVKEAIFLSRPNRFIANVIVDGEVQVVHVKNTGRCKELLYEGARIYLEDYEDNQRQRKTRYSLVTVEKKDPQMDSGIRLVNIDSHAPNKVVGEGLANGSIVLPGFDLELTRIKPESTFGDSRFDFYVEGSDGHKAYIEVKGVTLEDGGIVRFPDAPTERGIKHVRELCNALEQDFFAYIIFVIQMENVSYFEPNDETHFAFGQVLREAKRSGVTVLAYDCQVENDSMVLRNPVDVKL